MLWRKSKLGKGDRGVVNLFKVLTDTESFNLKDVRKQVARLSGKKAF